MTKSLQFTEKMDRVTTCIFIFAIQCYFWLGWAKIWEIPGMRNVGYGLYVLALGMVGVKVLFNRKYTLFSFLLIGSLSVLSIVAKYVYDKNTIFMLMLFVFGTKGVEFGRVIKFFTVTNGLILMGVSLCSVVGILPFETMYEDDWLLFRLGFRNPNLWGMIYLMVLMGVVYLNYQRLDLCSYLIFGGLSAAAYILNHSRGMILCILIFMVLILANKYLHLADWLFRRKWSIFVIYSIFPILTALSYVLAKYYRQVEFLYKLNLKFTYRFALWGVYVQWFNTGAWSKYHDLAVGASPLDSTYLVLLYKRGWIPFLVFMLIFMLAVKYAYKYKNNVALAICVTYTALMFIEGIPEVPMASLMLVYGLNCIANDKQYMRGR